jgi:hypothetical protein
MRVLSDHPWVCPEKVTCRFVRVQVYKGWNILNLCFVCIKSINKTFYWLNICITVWPARRCWTLTNRHPQLHFSHSDHPPHRTPSHSTQTGKVTTLESANKSDLLPNTTTANTIKVVTEALTDKNSTHADQTDHHFTNSANLLRT